MAPPSGLFPVRKAHRQRTFGPANRAGKLQSTASREIRGHAVQYRALPLVGACG